MIDRRTTVIGRSPDSAAQRARFGIPERPSSKPSMSPRSCTRHDPSAEADEEIYVVVRGGGRIKLNHDIVEIRTNDAIRVAPTTIREWEAGPDGLALIAFGTHTEGDGGHERDRWPA